MTGAQGSTWRATFAAGASASCLRLLARAIAALSRSKRSPLRAHTVSLCIWPAIADAADVTIVIIAKQLHN